MIACRNARQIFDRYLDDELSPGLQAELHAHRINCSECQAELALLEACGDVIAMDRCEPRLSGSFTDRVLLARRAHNIRSQPRWSRRIAVVATPLAAAAGLALAWISLFPAPGAAPEKPNSGLILSEEVSVSADAVTVLRGGREDELPRTASVEASGLVKALIAPVVEKAGSSIGTLRSGMTHMELLIQDGLSAAGKQLAVRRSSTDGHTPARTTDSEWLLPSLEPWTPFTPAVEQDLKTLEAF